MNNRDVGKKCGVQKMADGGTVGLLERLKMGNIDQEGSEAYNRFGKGAAAGVESSDARQLARNEANKPEPVTAVDNESDAQSRRMARSEESTPVDNESDAQSRRMAQPAPAPTPVKRARRSSPVGDKGTSFASGLASGIKASDDRQFKRNQGSRTYGPDDIPGTTRPKSLVDQIPTTTRMARLEDQIPGMANGGVVGGSSRNYGKK